MRHVWIFLMLYLAIIDNEKLRETSAVIEKNRLDISIHNSDSFEFFKRQILSFFRLESKSIYNIPGPHYINYLTRLRLGFNHLKKRNSDTTS